MTLSLPITGLCVPRQSLFCRGRPVRTDNTMNQEEGLKTVGFSAFCKDWLAVGMTGLSFLRRSGVRWLDFGKKDASIDGPEVN